MTGADYPLHDAAASGRTDRVRRALKDGARVGDLDSLKRTPLHVASELGRVKVVAVLLEVGAKVKAKDYRRSTALHLAAAGGHREVASLLLAGGAPARVKNAGKCTALHELARGGGKASGPDRVSILERLLESGCPLDARDSVGRTALWFAASTGTSIRSPAIRKSRLVVLAALLERGAKRHASATNPPITPIDAARGRHQSKAYRTVWHEAVELLS